MLGNIFLPLIALLLSFPALAVQANSHVVFEAAPLKGALGQVSLRGEYLNAKRFGYGIAFEDISEPGVRDNTEDHRSRLQGEMVWYPPVEGAFDGIFAGIGAMYERAKIGHQENRQYRTGVRPDSAHQYDRWTSNDNYYSATQSFGYRYAFTENVTMSLRMVIDELLYQQSTTENKDVYSYDLEPKSERRDAVKQYFSLMAGLKF